MHVLNEHPMERYKICNWRRKDHVFIILNSNSKHERSRRRTMLLRAVAIAFISWVAYTSLLRDSALLCPASEPFEEGFVALVTGTSRGVGRSIALRYAERGASLIITARRMEELESVAEECRIRLMKTKNKRAKVVTVVGDVAQDEARKEIQKRIEADFGGKLNVAVLNHAVNPMKLLTDIKSWNTEFFSTMDINFKSSVLLSEIVLPYLEKTAGTLAGIGTNGELTQVVGLGAYIVSKTALCAFFDYLRLELGFVNSRVTVSYITLGTIDTEQLAEKYVDPELRKQKDWMLPLLSPAEAARQIQCALDRKVPYTVVPFVYHWLQLPTLSRDTWPFANRVGWLASKPDLIESIARKKREYDNVVVRR